MREQRVYLINKLLDENKYKRKQVGQVISDNEEEQKKLLRELMNVRPPKHISKDVLDVQDKYLAQRLDERGITDINDNSSLKGIAVWQGDITTLRVDAVVNSAHNGLTGCFIPGHKCIDNCIHTYAGMQLRFECNNIMKKRLYRAEKVGKARITSGYNLPSKYIIHTVGPRLNKNEKLKNKHIKQLESCYVSCFKLADEMRLKSIAFPCISTGGYNFPRTQAACIAISTISNLLQRSKSIEKVIFSVFNDKDMDLYLDVLRKME